MKISFQVSVIGINDAKWCLCSSFNHAIRFEVWDYDACLSRNLATCYDQQIDTRESKLTSASETYDLEVFRAFARTDKPRNSGIGV